MKELYLGDKTVLVIELGTWHMGNSIAAHAKEIKAIQVSIDAGAIMIDTAGMYGNGRNEGPVGEAIANIDREKSSLIDKALPSNTSVDEMSHGLDTSLELLGTDYVDLYLYHWRGAVLLSETVEMFRFLQQQGKIKHWGVSNFDLPDTKELLALPDGDWVAVNEDLYNLDS